MAAWKAIVSASSCVRRPIQHRRQVGAAAEPPFGGHHHARIHVRGGHMGARRMGDQRHARRPEARVVLGAGDLLAELRRELAMHGGSVDAGLLEHATRDQAHLPAASAAARIGAGPRLAHEPARRLVAERRTGRQVRLQPLERRAQVVAQRLEPSPRALLLCGERRACIGHCIVSARIAGCMATRAGAPGPIVLRGAPLDVTTSRGATAMIEIIAIFDR